LPPIEEPDEIGIPTIGHDDTAKPASVKIGKPIAPVKPIGHKEADPLSKFWNWMTQLF
jgi:hypothetical protein